MLRTKIFFCGDKQIWQVPACSSLVFAPYFRCMQHAERGANIHIQPERFIIFIPSNIQLAGLPIFSSDLKANVLIVHVSVDACRPSKSDQFLVFVKSSRS